MLATTTQIIRSALQADPSLSPRDRTKFIAVLRHVPNGNAELPKRANPNPRVVRRGEAARMYSCSVRLIDRLAAQGVLQKIRLPGRQRSCGFLEADLIAVIAHKQAA